MPCERCVELELLFINRTEEYIKVVERQCRMFRNGEAQAGRDLDAKIIETKTSRTEALKELNEHQASHDPPPLRSLPGNAHRPL